MRFPFKQVAYSRSFVTLGGRTVRPRPIVTISLVGPLRTLPEQARIDSGSDDTLFPERVAAQMGLDLTGAPVEIHQTQGLGSLRIRYSQVKLRLTDGVEFREWPAWVGFAAGLSRAVLGFSGFLQFFTTTIHGETEIVELDTNPLFPGT